MRFNLINLFLYILMIISGVHILKPFLDLAELQLAGGVIGCVSYLLFPWIEY